MLKEFAHIIGYMFGTAAFAMVYWSGRSSLIAAGRNVHLKVLIAVNFFRYFGLTALLPGVFNLSPAGFSDGYLMQIMAGDVLISILALVAFALVELKSTYHIAFVWLFNILGTLDYLNAAARVTPSIHDANILGPFGWIIITVFLPAWLVSHIAIYFVLLQKPSHGAGDFQK